MPARPRSRWKLASEALVLALGVNMWVSLVLVPGLYVGALQRYPGAPILLVVVPLVVLVIALRLPSPTVPLLLVFPATLLIPLVLDIRIVAGNMQSPLAFSIVAAGVVAYLLGVSAVLTAQEPPPPVLTRPLPGATAVPVRPSSRWSRRVRMYRELIVLSVVFPFVLLYGVNFSPVMHFHLRQNYPARTASVITLLDLGLIFVWLGLFVVYILGPLRAHRTGDKELLRGLERLRQSARRGTPRPIFYVAVTGALVSMLLLILLRYR